MVNIFDQYNLPDENDRLHSSFRNRQMQQALCGLDQFVGTGLRASFAVSAYNAGAFTLSRKFRRRWRKWALYVAA
jgi:hypothetical protein